jgi:hypothetical protein
MCYLLAALSPVLAQEPIQITASDLPGEGDTYRMSIATNPQSIDIEKAGPDQTWNYQNLNAATQYISTSIRSGAWAAFLRSIVCYPSRRM